MFGGRGSSCAPWNASGVEEEMGKCDVGSKHFQYYVLTLKLLKIINVSQIFRVF